MVLRADLSAAVLGRPRTSSQGWPLALALGALAWSSCAPYDPDKIASDPPPSGEGGRSGEAVAAADAGRAGGGAGASICMGGVETCNRIDDDCDGATDEGARASCERIVVNAETDCVPFEETSACVLLDCLDGYDSCDGDPTNGCEAPYCNCHECDDAGGEDAGSEDAGD